MKNHTKSSQLEELRAIVVSLQDFMDKGGQISEIRDIFNNLDMFMEKVEDKDEIKYVVSLLERFIHKGGQIEELRDIVENFSIHLEQEQQQHMAVVTTATALNDSQKEDIQTKLEDTYNRSLECEFIVNPAILGGMKVKIYDNIVDMTIDNALETLVQSLKH